MVYNCIMHKRFTSQNFMLKLPDSITVTAVMSVTVVHSVTNEEENVIFQEEILCYRFCFMIKQKYALQHIAHRNCDSTNIFFNSDRKLLCLNLTYLQLSIPFMVFCD